LYFCAPAYEANDGGQSVSDMVGPTEIVYRSARQMQLVYRLHSGPEVPRETNQSGIPVVELAEYHAALRSVSAGLADSTTLVLTESTK
jgi:hypothetical protein